MSPVTSKPAIGAPSEELYLYIGVVEPKVYKRLSRKMLEEIESLLVWVMKPAGNTAKRKPYKGREMLIRSIGDDFGLPQFLYVLQTESLVRVGYGPSPDDMTFKMISPFKYCASVD